MLLRCFLTLLVFAPALHAARVKDLAFVSGSRSNQLIGYGIVVGLAGDGDSNAVTTLRSVANILQRNGLTVDPTQIKAKNSAAVMITADISAFLKPGARIDVTVASMGDAKSLQGGVLLQAPLMGADGRVYAVAQGGLAVDYRQGTAEDLLAAHRDPSPAHHGYPLLVALASLVRRLLRVS